MLRAILEDFQGLGRHEIRSTLDVRLRASVPSGLPVTIIGRDRYPEIFAASVAWAEAVLLIAPETDGVLARLSAQVENVAKRLLGSTSTAVAAAADKATTHSCFRASGIPTARISVISFDDEPIRQVATFGYPAVVKPIDGAGCEGVSVIRRQADVSRALRRLRKTTRRRTFLIQEYIAGIPASLSCLSDGTRVLPLTLNTQYIHSGSGLRYRGGTIHIQHSSRSAAFEMVRDLQKALPGLRGYFGIDLVLTRSGPVFIEVNPRLTTSYVGLRRAFSVNLAEALLESALGQLPILPKPKGCVRFFVDRGSGVNRKRG
ncbi:MAG: ATP-grasp domain-containing protein [Candidatus Methylomirabilia bacterium]